MRWASTLNDDCAVLALMRSLPNQVVQEQICRYNARETAVAARNLPNHKNSSGVFPTIRCNAQSRIVSTFSLRCVGVHSRKDSHVGI